MMVGGKELGIELEFIEYAFFYLIFPTVPLRYVCVSHSVVSDSLLPHQVLQSMELSKSEVKEVN